MESQTKSDKSNAAPGSTHHASGSEGKTPSPDKSAKITCNSSSGKPPSPAESATSNSSSGTENPSGSDEASNIQFVKVNDENTNKTRCFTPNSWMQTILPQLQTKATTAVQSYKQFDEEARRNDKTFDGPVELLGIEDVLPDGMWLTAEQLGELCMATGPGVKLDAFPATKKIHVRQCASGFEHSAAVGAVSQTMIEAVSPYLQRPRYAVFTSYGTYGSLLSSGTAPGAVVSTWGVPGGGRANSTPQAPLFIAEVERGNRTLPALIRHLGMCMVNFPNLNGVVGLKGKEKEDGTKVAALVAIEWVSGTASVTSLIDFGPNALSRTERANAETTLALPRAPIGIDPTADQHGAGVTQQLPDWERVPNGTVNGSDFVYDIAPSLFLVGAHNVEGDELEVPANLAPARLNLADIADLYFGG